ncbi:MULTISPECIES: hypothetical protein [unclassified Nocardioides]|uniref:hypothetical protein n=1 Tax=unclassified Nocardioides TaxID=2615069 RepID=UPI000304B7F4|nr:MULTISPECIES: hypothetical protein [unclassified Nocardioides]
MAIAVSEPRRQGSGPADDVRAQIDRLGRLMQDEGDPFVAAVGAEISEVATMRPRTDGTEFARLAYLALVWALGEIEGRED